MAFPLDLGGLLPMGIALLAVFLVLDLFLMGGSMTCGVMGGHLDLATAHCSPDAHFDTVVATFVFCSVPDPVLGLTELRRVLVPGGQLLLLEHVLSTKPLLRSLMRLMNPIVVRMIGANIDRETVENVRRAGLVELKVTDLGPLDIVKSIDARAAGAEIRSR